MNLIHLYAERMTDRVLIHDQLAEAFDFPQWYGRNLDALYDLLADIGRPTTIRLHHCELLEGYGLHLIKVLAQVAADNTNICFVPVYGQ
jgi:ribonuclease inhibitor